MVVGHPPLLAATPGDGYFDLIRAKAWPSFWEASLRGLEVSPAFKDFMEKMIDPNLFSR